MARGYAPPAGLGRRTGTVPVTLFGAIPDPALLEAFAGAGVDRCLLPLPPGTASELLLTLDEWAPLARRR